MRISMRSVLCLLAAIAITFGPTARNGQAQVTPPSTTTTPVRQQTPQTPQERIVERLRQSGLSREQVRQRLQLAGYDPNLADRYFDQMERPETTSSSINTRYTQTIEPPSGNLLAALKRIGVLLPEDSLTAPKPDSVRPATTPRRPDVKGPQVFGRELFAATTQFEPVLSGPVDSSYRLGPGDRMTLLVTGDLEFAYDLEVTREGYIIIPDVGQVIVNGLTLDEAKRRLNERLARVYSGIQVGTTRADITVGRLRSKLVYVIGEVELPSAYELAGTATVFSALYRAAGPALNGSFRNIEVRRNNKVIAHVDLYDYLLRGDKSNDVTLEQSDVVFIPVVGPQVTVEGSVRRPAIFELKAGETLSDVMRFAGGAEASASLSRIQIDRIVPPNERRPGHERILVDVELEDIARGVRVAMQDGDHIQISKISGMRRNRVAVNGDVRRPGQYEYRVGMTAMDLISAADGLLPSAYTPAAQVVRLNQVDSSTSIIRVVLDDPQSPDHASKIVLADLDELAIFGRVGLAHPKTIEVFGYVKNEGIYPFSEGMTVQDIVLMAGGFREGADESMAEVARRTLSVQRGDTIATVVRAPLSLQISPDATGQTAPPFPLHDGDQIFIRRSPGFQPLATVTITGEVMNPGAYAVKARLEHVTDIVRRAGGLTPEAYARGLRLVRDGKPVAIDFPKALGHPAGTDDISIEQGDRIEVPRYDPTVLVTGAVTFESRVRYEDGLSIEDYVRRAGGATEDGNIKKASIRYPNGALRTVSKTLGVRRSPRVEPGSTITVPTRLEKNAFSWDQTVGRALTVLTTLATLLVAAKAVK